jgi:hypothetical protein
VIQLEAGKALRHAEAGKRATEIGRARREIVGLGGRGSVRPRSDVPAGEGWQCLLAAAMIAHEKDNVVRLRLASNLFQCGPR